VITARRLVEQLLDEALMAPVKEWRFASAYHLVDQYKRRLEKIFPIALREQHALAIEANIRAFRENTAPVVVGDENWWMPFPFRWKLIGHNSLVNTIYSPFETVMRDSEQVDNPFLTEVQKTHWR
jgi:hypothetical protein